MFLIKRLKKTGPRRPTVEGKGVAITLYKLSEDRKVLLCNNLEEWANFMSGSAREKRVVSQTQLENTYISTVFVGIDVIYDKHEPNPRVFETLVRFKDGSSYRFMSASWEEAEAKHLATVRDLAARERLDK